MGIASVLMIAIATVTIGTLRGVTTINVKTATTADGRIAMEAMSRAMRVTFKPTGLPSGQDTALVKAAPDDIIFYSLMNRTGGNVTSAPNPTKVRFVRQNGCINQIMTPAVADQDGNLSWPDSGAVTTCLARTSQDPAFAYYTSGGPDGAQLGPTTAGLSLNDRKQVRSIAISINVQDAQNTSVKGVPMQDRVTLTNLVADDSNNADAVTGS